VGRVLKFTRILLGEFYKTVRAVGLVVAGLSVVVVGG
jgi:hypothetical protein